jgi:hypothetical protein
VYSTLLFSPTAQKEKVDWNSSMSSSRLYVAQLSFLWSYGVFRYSVSLRVVIVFRDIISVIIILYSWYLDICEHFWPYVWNIWSWVMHTMSTWFWHKNQVWHKFEYWFESPWHPRIWVMACSPSPNIVIELHLWFIWLMRWMLLMIITYIKLVWLHLHV